MACLSGSYGFISVTYFLIGRSWQQSALLLAYYWGCL